MGEAILAAAGVAGFVGFLLGRIYERDASAGPLDLRGFYVGVSKAAGRAK